MKIIVATFLSIFLSTNSIYSQIKVWNLSLKDSTKEELYFFTSNQLKVDDPRITRIHIENNKFIKDFKLGFQSNSIFKVHVYSDSSEVLLSFYSGDNLIEEKIFPVKKIEKPFAILGNTKAYKLKKAEILNHPKLNVQTIYCLHKECHDTIRIDSFILNLHTNQGKKIFSETIMGDTISKTAMQIIQDIEPGGYILCTKVKGSALGFDKEEIDKIIRESFFIDKNGNHISIPLNDSIMRKEYSTIFLNDISVFIE